MRDLLFLGLTVAFFALTAWLAAFAERLMPRPRKQGTAIDDTKDAS